MAKSRGTIQQTEVEKSQVHTNAKDEFYFYVGERYYRRMQPTPYKYIFPDINKLKKYLERFN